MLKEKLQNIMTIWSAYKFYAQKKVTAPINYGSEKILIVATGPSSNRFWKNQNYRNKWIEKSYDICLLNDAFFKYKDIVFQIKPRFFSLVDSAYFDRKGVTPDEIERMKYAKANREILNEVDWDLTLIIPATVSVPWLTNSKIKLCRLNLVVNNRNSLKSRFFFYKKNWMNPGRNNVVHAALYFAITFGYKQIALLGGEFNFWKNMYLNENRHVIQEVEHCFEVSKVERVADIDEDYGGYRQGTMSVYLSRLSETFSIYAYIREYADVMGARVVNYSEDTMIESFEIAKSVEMTDE